MTQRRPQTHHSHTRCERRRRTQSRVCDGVEGSTLCSITRPQGVSSCARREGPQSTPHPGDTSSFQLGRKCPIKTIKHQYMFTQRKNRY